MKETLFKTRWLALNRIGHWDFVSRPDSDDCVGILAITDEQKVILVEQFRIPVQKRTVELPAGIVGDEEEHRGEPLEETARRELLEETGYEADSVKTLCISPTSAGMTSEQTHLFIATGLHKAGPGGGVAGEDISTTEVALDELREYLKSREQEGLLIDYKIYAALWMAGL